MKKLMKKIKMNNKGFTLVELIVVIAVLAIITVVAAPQYIRYVEKSRVGTDENALGEIAHVAEISFAELQGTSKAVKKGTDDNYSAKLVVTIEGGAIKDYAGKGSNADLAAIVDDIVPTGTSQYAFKSETYKNGTATIEIINGAAKITSEKPFTWAPTK